MKTRSLPFVFAAFAVFAVFLLFPTRARAQMSETEKKAAARAAYQEGVKLQDDGKYAEALVRFESAQKLFDAPTHLLHIAECQALTGRLVEASENYELLARKTLAPGSPDAFQQAQQQGQAELPALRARIPTLRVTVKPGPQQVQNLQVNVNGVNMPNELLGIARPLNPGVYRFNAQAVGWSTPSAVDVPLGEKEQKSVELTMQQGSGGAVIVAPPPQPYQGGGQPPPGAEKPRPKPSSGGPTSLGLLFGIRAGGVVPAGQVLENQVTSNAGSSTGNKIEDVATPGGGFGIDAYLRVVRMLLIGATFEYASLGTPSTVVNRAGDFERSAHATYIGLNVGIVPNVDKVSFIGDVGIGSRTLADSLKGGTGTSQVDSEGSATGVEFGLGAGVSIPAGPVRIVPRANLGLGSFSSLKSTNNLNSQTQSVDIPSASRATHAFFFLGVALYYSLDFGAKPSAQDIE